jgi:hypothetical protein
VRGVNPVVEGLAEFEHAEKKDEEERQDERELHERGSVFLVRSS